MPSGFTVFEFWLDIPSLTLETGTTYWASIVEDSAGDLFAIAKTGSGTGLQRTLDPQGDWSEFFAIAFNLTGKVPEPASLAIFGFGLLGLGAMRRRKRTA